MSADGTIVFGAILNSRMAGTRKTNIFATTITNKASHRPSLLSAIILSVSPTIVTLRICSRKECTVPHRRLVEE